MYRIFITLSLILAISFFISIESANAQFQTFPQTDRYSITGEKVKTPASPSKARKGGRYLNNGSKKKKVKTKRLFVRKHGVSNFSVYSSSKTTRRNKLLNRKRRKLS